jgi:hypothetical protein
MTVNVDIHFSLADLYISHLRANPAVAADPFIASRHVGFRRQRCYGLRISGEGCFYNVRLAKAQGPRMLRRVKI